jgi:hypothetical protein
MPEEKEERASSRIVRGGIFAACVVTASTMVIPGDISPVIRFAGIIAAVLICVGGMRYAGGKRQQYGFYYGTLSRSLAPVYAFSIILLSLIAQPWLMYNEA